MYVHVCGMCVWCISGMCGVLCVLVLCCYWRWYVCCVMCVRGMFVIVVVLCVCYAWYETVCGGDACLVCHSSCVSSVCI